MALTRKQLLVAMAAVQLTDAVACAIPLAYLKRDLDRLGCPEELQAALPVIKAVAGTGLLVGVRRPWVGRLTASSLVAYFTVAVGFHVRATDPVLRHLPAVGLGVLSAYIATEPA